MAGDFILAVASMMIAKLRNNEVTSVLSRVSICNPQSYKHKKLIMVIFTITLVLEKFNNSQCSVSELFDLSFVIHQ